MLTSIGLTNETNVGDIIQPVLKIVDDSNHLMIYDEEKYSERTIKGENNNEDK